MCETTEPNPLDLVGEVIDLGYRIKGTGTGYVVSVRGVSLHPDRAEIPDSISALSVLIAHLSTRADC